MNKINNYLPDKPVKCEMVRVGYAPEPEAQPAISIYRIEGSSGNGYLINIYYNLNIPATTVDCQVYGYGGPYWASNTYNAQSPRYFSFSGAGTYKIRLYANGEYSNEAEITIPLTGTINLP
jgi:hypothetical protein